MRSTTSKVQAVQRRWVARLRGALLWCAGWPLTGVAGNAAFAAPEQVAPAHPGFGALRVVAALLLVIGAVIIAGRLARRLRGLGGGGSAGLEVLGQLPVGPRERAVLVRVGDRQLLLGVAPGQVRTLHVFEELLSAHPVAGPRALTATATATSAPAERPTFKSMLLKSLGK